MRHQTSCSFVCPAESNHWLLLSIRLSSPCHLAPAGLVVTSALHISACGTLGAESSPHRTITPLKEVFSPTGVFSLQSLRTNSMHPAGLTVVRPAARRGAGAGKRPLEHDDPVARTGGGQDSRRCGSDWKPTHCTNVSLKVCLAVFAQ